MGRSAKNYPALKILIVDDHAVVREGVRRLLSKTHVSLFEAADGDEALVVFRKKRPKLVLLDLNLPGLGGFELLRRIIAEHKQARIIVFSVHTEPVYASRALRLGARGYVSKSAGCDEFVSAINRV